MFTSNLTQNNLGSLKNNNVSFDTKQNKISKSATNMAYSPLYYTQNRVSTLGSTFNNNANVKLQFGKDNLYRAYGTYTDSIGTLIPPKVNPQFTTIQSNGDYQSTNKIVKMDKYGTYFNFGKKKIYM